MTPQPSDGRSHSRHSYTSVGWGVSPQVGSRRGQSRAGSSPLWWRPDRQLSESAVPPHRSYCTANKKPEPVISLCILFSAFRANIATYTPTQVNPKESFFSLDFFLFIHNGQNTSRSKWLNWHHLKQVHRMILKPGFYSKGWNQLILSPRTRGRCSRYRGRGTRYSAGGTWDGAVGRSTGGPLSGPAGPRSTPVGPWSRNHRSGSTGTNQTSSNNIPWYT